MKIWTNNKFQGHWPVGTAAVVVATDAANACEYLNLFLAEQGFPETRPEDFEEMPHKEGEVRILNNGDY